MSDNVIPFPVPGEARPPRPPPTDPLRETRFTATAATRMREAIRAAGGIEIFAVGKLNGRGEVMDLEVHCRGNTHSVPALLSRPRSGEVVIHNHPSGMLQASPADMALANRYGEDGVGVVIVDNSVERALWVVEPYRRPLRPVPEDEIRAFFTERMPRAMPGHEPREAQIEMACHVARALNEGHLSITEAGTGTGKSLAYLVPAVLWATRNEARVAVATFTINLQGQLVTSDIPVLQRAGLDFSFALLKGRSNYLCRRRLKEEAEREGAEAIFREIAGWAATSQEGSRADLSFPLEEDQWDLIASDHDQTLRARCPHFNECFYYQARRRAAQAHLVVVNHHLLLADLLVKGETGGDGILPRFDRVILDEGHHLEDAATSLFQQQITGRSLRRSIGPLVPRKKRPGALDRIAGFHAASDGPLPPEDQLRAQDLLRDLQGDLLDLHERVGWWLETLAQNLLTPEQRQLRVTPALEATVPWELHLKPTVQSAGERLAKAAQRLSLLEGMLAELPDEFVLKDPQPLLDLARARRRILEQSGFLFQFLQDAPEQVRWIEEARGRRQLSISAALCAAPIEVGPTLRTRLFDAMTGIATCSATMTVDKRFDHYLSRVGLAPADGTAPPAGGPRLETAMFASPFDYRRQALLGLPQDIPPPDDRTFEEVSARFIIDALRVSGGGAFVLCTSFSMLRGLHRRCQEALGDELMLLRQGELGRMRLLELFREHPDSVLFGTDAFWEGVSVKGEALRLVIIPKLPFRVPTEPVQQARHERMAAQGIDPFRAYSLPQAVLRLRQGFGRLIRSRDDWGAVLVLDARVTRRWYGRVFLGSLPELETVRAPGRVVLERMDAFFRERRS